MAASSQNINVLESRLEKVEKLVYCQEPKNFSTNKVIPSLIHISSKLKDAEGSEIQIRKLYAQLNELQKYADLCHADVIEKQPEAKIAYIEASEKQLKTQAGQLETVDKLKWVLDSEHLKSRVTSNLNTRLLKLSDQLSVTRDESESSMGQTKQLIDNYNKAISEISIQFERWNALITALEEQQNIIKD